MMVAMTTAAFAAVPAEFTQQGRLFDSAGDPIDGPMDFTFAIYSSASGGTALWTETQNVTIDNGYFSTILGEVTTLDPAIFDGAVLYLGVSAGSDAEMTPRLRT